MSEEEPVKYRAKDDPYCIHTIPSDLLGNVNDLPIIIPDSITQSDDVLACLYHRYVTTIQTLCKQPKLIGRPDRYGGYICIDNYLLETGKCTVVIVDPDLDYSYSEQVRIQHNCIISRPNATNIDSALRKWMLQKKSEGEKTSVLVLKFDIFENDITVFQELIHTNIIMSKVNQISLKLFIDPERASDVEYRNTLYLLKEISKLGFRIFSFDRDVDCLPPSSMKRQFLSCYSVYFIRPQREVHEIVSIPDESILKSMRSDDILRIYDTYLSSVQTLCQQNLRLGHIRDGGWNVCHDVKYRPRSPPCLIYSFGIAGDWTFDEQSSQTYGCRVFSFDPTIGFKNHKHSDLVWFYGIGIDAKTYINKRNWKLMPLDSIMQLLKHASLTIDILKMDVEGSEWPALRQMLDSKVLNNVRQLNLELHSAFSVESLLIMKDLFSHGFKIFWTRKNRNPPNFMPLDGCLISSGFEISLINTKFNHRVIN